MTYVSVPVPQRGHGELEVNTKARDLTAYTFKILANDKWFPKDHEAYIDILQKCVLQIQQLCWDANNIRVDNDATKYSRRLSMQEEAIGYCNRMSMLIETAKSLFHLTNHRVIYWGGMVSDLRKMITAWRSKDASRLLPKEGG